MILHKLEQYCINGRNFCLNFYLPKKIQKSAGNICIILIFCQILTKNTGFPHEKQQSVARTFPNSDLGILQVDIERQIVQGQV